MMSPLTHFIGATKRWTKKNAELARPLKKVEKNKQKASLSDSNGLPVYPTPADESVCIRDMQTTAIPGTRGVADYGAEILKKKTEALPEISKALTKVQNNRFESEAFSLARHAFPCSDIATAPIKNLTQILLQGREQYIFSSALHALLGLCFYAQKRGHDAAAAFEESEKLEPENQTSRLYKAICAESGIISVAKHLHYQVQSMVRFTQAEDVSDDLFTKVVRALMSTGREQQEATRSLEQLHGQFPDCFAAVAGASLAVYQAERKGVERASGSRSAAHYARKASEIRPNSPLVPLLLRGRGIDESANTDRQVFSLWSDEDVVSYAKKLFLAPDPLYMTTFFSFPTLAIDDYIFQRSPFAMTSLRLRAESAGENAA